MALGRFVIAATSFCNTELVKFMDIDKGADYMKEKWVKLVEPHPIDIVYDCVVKPSAWNERIRKVSANDNNGQFTVMAWIMGAMESLIGGKEREIVCVVSSACLEKTTVFIDVGKMDVPIDSLYPSNEFLDPMQIQKPNRARGKIILEIASDNEPDT